MQNVNNMGSLLQAYGLKKMIESLGHEVEFINIKKIDEDYGLLGNYIQDYSNENEKTGAIGRLKKIDKYICSRLVHRGFERQQDELFDIFRKEELNIEQSNLEYDVCVIGSDEVFNCLNAGYWGFTSQLFGKVSCANRVITYAASCGATSYDQLPDKVKSRIIEAFRNISAFSVRDENSFDFVSKMTEQSISRNLDPVLIYDFRCEIENSPAIMQELPSKYCIVYSYRNRIHRKSEIEHIRDFCKRNNLIPIAVGAPQFWIKDYIVCSPFQCLSLFKGAEYVITDTFHGTIFSAKYAKNYAVIIRESNKNKLSDLVERLHIKKHLINDFEQLQMVSIERTDEMNIKNIISREKTRSMDYLRRNL